MIERLGRRHKLALAVLLALAWTVASAGAAAALDLGGTGFVALVLVGLVVAVAFDITARIERVASTIADVDDRARRDLGAEMDRLRDEISRVTVTARELLDDAVDSLCAEIATMYRQLEALQRLRDLAPVTGPTPPLRGWAASPDVLVWLVTELRRLRPRFVLECGSGASTVWLSIAVRAMQLETRIVAFEHDSRFAAETVRFLDDNGLGDVAEVRIAELEPITIGDYTGTWYAADVATGVHDVGLVFVDGPPGATDEAVRYPALPILLPALAPTATVVLDDTIREEERDIARRWAAEFPEFVLEFAAFEKGAAVLRRTPESTAASARGDVPA